MTKVFTSEVSVSGFDDRGQWTYSTFDQQGEIVLHYANWEKRAEIPAASFAEYAQHVRQAAEALTIQATREVPVSVAVPDAPPEPPQ